MKYLYTIFLALMFIGCKHPVKHRDLYIASSIKSYVDSLAYLSIPTKPMKIDSIKIILIDNISESKHWDMEIEALQAMQKVIAGDSATNKQSLSAFQKWQNEIDSIKAIKANNQLWGYHVKAKLYLRGVDDKENELFFFVSKEYKARLDTKYLAERSYNNYRSN